MKVNGLDKLMAKLDALGGNSKATLAKSIDDCGTFVRDDARLRCPVDTGDLRQSIGKETKVTADRITTTVGTSMEYAPYVEFGTGQRGEATNTNPNIDVSYRQDWSGQKAQPYLYPALKDNEDQLAEKIKKDLKKEIRRRTI
jgi:HK97 gp10 family phage protein